MISLLRLLESVPKEAQKIEGYFKVCGVEFGGYIRLFTIFKKQFAFIVYVVIAYTYRT